MKLSKGLTLILIVSLSVGGYAPLAQASSPGSITAHSIVLLKPGTNEILYSRAPHRKQPVASTTKVVTALLAIEKLNLDNWVTIDSSVESVQASKLYLKGRDAIRGRDLLKAILMKSANDAAMALAIEIAGSEREFARMMTTKARQIGAKKTRFINSSGLPGAGQYSTAFDLALIMSEAKKNPTIMSIMKQKSAVVRSRDGNRYFFKSHNKMLWRSEEVIGKTGWTQKSKHCFLGLIRSRTTEVVVAMLGSNALWNDLTRLLRKFRRLIGVNGPFLLSRGAEGKAVIQLQDRLMQRGYFKARATGYFGDKTKEAVLKFQAANHLRVDGIVGPETRKALALT
jgi:serine-type D-Ala-D-Ala carboxypeptidase (penicillin-binding protein 5/6)